MKNYVWEENEKISRRRKKFHENVFKEKIKKWFIYNNLDLGLYLCRKIFLKCARSKICSFIRDLQR